MSVEIANGGMARNGTFWNFKGEVDYVDEWFLMKSPASLLLIILAYWSFVLKLGPVFMKNKPAYNLRNTIATYNIAQVVFSCYLCYLGQNLILSNGLLTSSCLMEDETKRLQITRGSYIYFLAKLSELFDTVFFVLRKKYNQITFLHVYHHSVMLACTWVTLKYEPTYNTVFLGTINSYVHVIMYAYYYLSAFPSLSKYLWWKKYITKIQIIQFLLIILQAVGSYYLSGCPPSYTLLVAIMWNSLFFTGLFINFYIHSYKAKNKKE